MDLETKEVAKPQPEARSATAVVGGVSDALLEGARNVLARVGYRAATARAISAETGVNLRSIGYHYGSVKELVRLAFSRNFREWLAPLTGDVPEEPKSASAQIREGLDIFTGSFESHGPMMAAWLEAVLESRSDPQALQGLIDQQTVLRLRLTKNLQRAGIDDAESVATAFITICDGLMVRHLLYGTAPSVQELIDQAHRGLVALYER